MVASRHRPGGRPESVGGVRVALGLVSGAVAIAVCAVLVDRFVLGAEWWQVRHTVTAEPVTPQREVGPPPGPLAVSWERTTRTHHGSVPGFDGVAYAVAQGQLVTASGRGLDVRDARTGGPRWSYRRSGWTLLGWASTRSRLVAYFERDGDRSDRLLVAFDALSGGLLWRREGTRPAAVSRTTLRWPAGSDVLLTTDEPRRTLFGVSAVTGRQVWRLPLPRGCRLAEGGARPSDGRETLTALALECAGGDRRGRLLAVDPAKGAVRWDRRLGSAESPDVSMLDGVTLASDGTALRAFGDDGEQVAAWAGDVCGDAMCPGVLAGGRLVVVYHPKGAKRGATRMEAVRVPSGRVEWRRDVPAYAALTQAGGHVFALRPRLAERLLPAGVDIVEPLDGRTATAPAPFAMNPDLPGARPWLAATGGLLYAAVPQAAPRPDGATRLVVLRGGLLGPGPAELDGVPAADWPDACALLKKPDLAAARMPGHRSAPAYASAGGVRLPHPVSCAYEPRHRDPGDGTGRPPPDRRERGTRDPSASPSGTASPSDRPTGPGHEEGTAGGFTVSVRWTARTDQAASQMLDALQATQAQSRRRRDIGADEAYEIGPTAGMIALRVARCVVVVEADRPPGAAARLARSVAYRLRAPS
ncbi:PQQ-binding-like beta-propeller repeat protein [Actinomadura decatromicini]|uniref:PQQ-binding-like beta-propeller repeat protein n=1 Tax=Actinomadura decatromicini TaxID=2604572 RepID=A0A5D3FZA4_9ACTN|nr:PQQ-binding-like beta-propeller repeat protein [Actinomadura decatromicini]TYK53513.1 PQQ-binding-like beta-propeller repeat protein [Actinomadura decatromicini]